MKIGFVQFAPELADVQATMTKLQRLSASFESADLLVLPELCNSGYNFESKQQAIATSENLNDSAFVRFLQELCSRHHLHIVSGFNERAGNHLYNSAILVSAKGVIGHYRKLHLFLNEKDFFEPGDLGLPVFELPGCKIGMLICFDWIFPETWRVLMLKGAELVCHPSNLVLPGFAQRGLPGNAMMNRLYTITANRIGTERGLTFTGLSIICDPRGELLAKGHETEETVSIVEIDPAKARDKNVTARNNILADRRPDLYGLICAGDKNKPRS